ncbi:alanine racemase [Paraglaciecola arctica]|uniref:Alanine racemase n=1 Tax=Paraglaciecola arctica BSs20135 TaxID=493475 RepID=K6XE76_9ALTE|nr:alanine racemase [Paraglaciecola arctica]GAC18934.1 alanine racemase [Paraglaciecola arctica BSs20135]
MPRNTKATIHLDAIIANYQLAVQAAPNSENIAVIKADAYGHGSVRVAQALEPYVPAFAVAIFEEAVVLREAGIRKPLLVLQGINDSSELEFAAANTIWPMVENDEQAKLIGKTPLKSALKVWLKIDTGMNRLGLNDVNLLAVINRLKRCSWVDENIVLSSHLACASDLTNVMTNYQLQKFSQLTKKLNLSTSVANSAALLGFPDARMNWNRPGIMLYGLSPFDDINPQDKLLKPAMTFSSSVIAIREVKKGEDVGYGSFWQANKPSIIATIAVGYADGYPRHAANGTPLLVAGQKAYLAGRVSMDMITADISQCTNIQIGDPVELWGKTINANEIARCAQTIGYQLLTSVSQRVPRQYD